MESQEVDELLNQRKGSTEKFRQRVCTSYGETHLGLARRQRAQDAMSGAMSNASTRALSPSSESPGKQCSLCHSAYSGFGSVCFRCRKQGSRGSAKQCASCSNYFHGFGDTCHDCKVLA